MKYEKTRVSLTIPTPLYDLLVADSKNYGIPQSSIVSSLLLDYYREKKCLADFTDAPDLSLSV